jgi:E3 SUMO-protein ligase RanBP2
MFLIRILQFDFFWGKKIPIVGNTGTRDQTACQLLQQIVDKLPATATAAATTPTAAPAAAETALSEEERLLLESFGVGLGPTPQPTPQQPTSLSAALYPLLQQQQLMFNMAAAAQQQLVAQQMGLVVPPQFGSSPAAPRPLLPAPPAPSAALPMYPGPMFGGAAASGGIHLPSAPAPPPALTGGPATMPATNDFGSLSVQQKESIFAAAAAGVTATPPRMRETGPPTNVVISRSDRIPVSAPPLAVSLSVTVPPQHRLGGLSTASTPQRVVPSPAAMATPPVSHSFFSTPQSAYKTPSGGASQPSPSTTPHNHQISLPDGVSPVIRAPFIISDAAQTGAAAVPITTQSLLSYIPTPIYSAVTPSPEKGILASGGSGIKSRMASGGGVTTPKARQPSIGEDGAPEEYEPQIEFAPVVPLPEEVEVVTGEEDETVLFEERAKLFRFADETKEWKERGVGQAKILRNVETGQVRFLMRRDQTYKVCANHRLLPDMKLDLMKGNAKARVWGAQDFADGELRTEKFCIRFKTEEQAESFQTAFVAAAKAAPAAGVTPKKADKEAALSTTTTGGGQTLAQFAAAQKAGSWECAGCLTRNDNAKIQCLACEGPKPGCEEEVKKLKEAAAATKPAAVMTLGAGGGFKFSSTAATTTITTSTTPGGFTFGGGITVTPVKPAAAGGFTFGAAAATTTSSSSGTTLGGFTFATPPTVDKKSAVDQDEKKKEEKKADEAAPLKPSPFAGFSFGGGTQIATAKTTTTDLFGGFGGGAKVEAVKAPEPISAGGKILGADSPSLSFVALANSSAEGFKKDPNFKGFAGAGTPLFGGGGSKKEMPPQPEKSEEKAEEAAGADEEYEPDVVFQPVVPLPELIEVKTGEEEEDSLFSERCKLFRFAAETKEWKERGVGDFKILKNRQSGRVRFLMRRDQVLKICCNHYLLPGMEITPLQTSDRAWTWSAADYAEGEVKNELFALKFKTAEMAGNWKSVVDQCQKELAAMPPSPKKSDETTSATGTKVEEIAAMTKTAATGGSTTTLAQFAAAQKAGSWECASCLTRNDNAKIQCLACEGPKPGCEEEVKKLKEAAKPAVPIMTLGAGGGFKFGNGSGAVAAAPAAGGFVFGGTTAAATTTTNGGFSFGKQEGTTTASPAKPLESQAFSFAGVKPAAAVSPRKHNESTNSENELYQEEEDNLYFEPVIPLPDKVEVKTGEEEETVLYSHRAKVYRYTDGEWKERGVGDIKILKHKASGKVRLLMRRDQVLKICLNHYVTPVLVAGAFKEKDPKSWTWAAQDYSDGELTSMTFALRYALTVPIYLSH